MKIDIFAHFITQKVIDAYSQRTGNLDIISMRPDHLFNIQTMGNIEKRLEIIHKYPGLTQVLTPTGDPIERGTRPEDTLYLMQVYNDELANLVSKHPIEFLAAVGVVPMNDVKAALKETRRVIEELGFKGILIHTPINGKGMDSPEYFPVYELMTHYNLPIWIHPSRHVSIPDYVGEKHSKFGLHQILAWPYETSIAMCRLACSGILVKYPNLKFITHHAGAMIPFFAGRFASLNPAFGQEILTEEELKQGKSPIEQLKMFYTDTAISGNKEALVCANEFFGPEHLLFGSDMPYGPGVGEQYLSASIKGIQDMPISDSAKGKIFESNARFLLNLR